MNDPRRREGGEAAPGAVGGIRRRLARSLTDAFAALGMEARIDPARLFAAQGYWRSDPRSDAFRWEGFFEVKAPDGTWLRSSISSWDSMTACCRGAIVVRDRGVSYICSAKEQ